MIIPCRFPERPIRNILAENSETAHEVLYYAAEDLMARNLFVPHENPTMLFVAKTRFELYNGDPFIAKEQLGEVLSTSRMLEKFPEADLLEVEVFMFLEDYPRAKQELGDSLENREIPQWIRNNGIIIEEETNF